MIMKLKITFFDTKPYDRAFFDRANETFGFDMTYYPSHLTTDNIALSKGSDAICVFVNDMLNKKIIDELYLNNIRLIALRSAGYNNVDLKAVFGKIHVVRVPAYSPHAVAEHAVALMLSLNRKTHRAYYRVRDNNFSINGLIGFDMYGKTAGVIGTGKIGRAVIDILKGFRMHILANDPYPDKHYAEQKQIQYTELDTLYQKSDIITLHCPLTPENVHMINAKTTSGMKDGVMIINTGRGKLINTVDLIDALKSKKIGAAGLDVYEEEEEYFFEDFSQTAVEDDVLARLLTFPNVLITSHQGFFTEEALTNIADTTLENIRLYFEEEKLPNEICYKCGITECRRKKGEKCF
jgi:D-lactate dehydrogenase